MPPKVVSPVTPKLANVVSPALNLAKVVSPATSKSPATDASLFTPKLPPTDASPPILALPAVVSVSAPKLPPASTTILLLTLIPPWSEATPLALNVPSVAILPSSVTTILSLMFKLLNLTSSLSLAYVVSISSPFLSANALPAIVSPERILATALSKSTCSSSTEVPDLKDVLIVSPVN